MEYGVWGSKRILGKRRKIYKDVILVSDMGIVQDSENEVVFYGTNATQVLGFGKAETSIRKVSFQHVSKEGVHCVSPSDGTCSKRRLAFWLATFNRIEGSLSGASNGRTGLSTSILCGLLLASPFS